MCLGVPGKIVPVEDGPGGMTMGKVSFSGIVKEVCLAYVPEAGVGDYVLVHVGFAISRIDERATHETLQALAEIGALEEIEDAEAPGEPSGSGA